MMPLPKVPGYELLQYLGGGPLTKVFSGRDCEFDSPCAIKVLREEWADQPAAIKLLQREARAGLAVSHPHLVRINYAHVLRPPYFLVMELLPGESLRRRLQREYRVDLLDTLWIARQSLEGLAALHRSGFTHGDVKPDNIRLVEDGTAKLIDLGFAHRPGENAALSRQGYLLGTADYLAPELCANDPLADESADLFSFGVTLYEMLTGQLPYSTGTTSQILKRHRCDPPADIRHFSSGLPSALATLVQQLLAHKPGDRPRAPTVVQQLIALEIATLRRRRSA
jgi:eukaryotic-like serine/threonine-protein kinase